MSERRQVGWPVWRLRNTSKCACADGATSTKSHHIIPIIEREACQADIIAKPSMRFITSSAFWERSMPYLHGSGHSDGDPERRHLLASGGLLVASGSFVSYLAFPQLMCIIYVTTETTVL